MIEEIKEILDDYKKLAGEITEKLDNTAEYESWLIIQDYVDEFLNYITNLQKENENLLYEINGYLKEKEELKDELYSTNQVVNELIDIQSRNKKAVEYIKNETEDLANKVDDYAISKYLKRDLLNILDGDDE